MDHEVIAINEVANSLCIKANTLVKLIQIMKPYLIVNGWHSKIPTREAKSVIEVLKNGTLPGFDKESRATLRELIRDKKRSKESRNRSVEILITDQFKLSVAFLAHSVGRTPTSLAQHIASKYPDWHANHFNCRLSWDQLVVFCNEYSRAITELAEDLDFPPEDMLSVVNAVSQPSTAWKINDRIPCSYIQYVVPLLVTHRTSSEYDVLGIPYIDRLNICAVFSTLVGRSKLPNPRLDSISNLLEERLRIEKPDRAKLTKIRSRHDNPIKYAKRIQTESARWMILWDLLALSVASGHYDARDRHALIMFAEALTIPLENLFATEREIAKQLREFETQDSIPGKRKKRKWWLVAVITIAGGAAVAITGGLAAPAIGGAIGSYFMGLSGAAAVNAGLAAIGGGAIAAGGGGMAAGTAIVTAVFGATGASIAAQRSIKLTGPVKEFEFVPIGGSGLHVVIGFSGFLSQKTDVVSYWQPLEECFQYSECYSLKWESKKQLDLGKTLITASGKQAVKEFITNAAKKGSKAAAKMLAAPLAVLQAIGLIGNPWQTAVVRAQESGRILADCLRNGYFGGRPVTLVGFSLGSRLIFHALKSLSETNSNGLVDSVVLMGSAITENKQALVQARKVVSRRFVNVFSSTDIVLNLLYRLGQVTIKTPAGVAPLSLNNIEDFDVENFVRGHKHYPANIKRILKFIGEV